MGYWRKDAKAERNKKRRRKRQASAWRVRAVARPKAPGAKKKGG